MKRILLLFSFLMFSFYMNGQIVSIRPDSGFRGQTLRTTITMATGAFTTSSPPHSQSDIFLQNGGTQIFADSYDPTINVYPGGGWPSFFSDSMFVDFTFLLSHPLGYYDLHVVTYIYDPWLAMDMPHDNVLPSSFLLKQEAGTVSGKVFFDANQNGLIDAGDFGIANQRIDIQPIGATAFTNFNGDFVVGLDTNTYDFNYSPIVGTSLTTAGTYNVTIPPSLTGMNFGIYCTNPQIFFGHTFSMYSHAMRCNSAGISGYTVSNTGLVTGQCSVTMVYSANLVFSSSSISPDSNNVATHTVRWDHPQLYHGQSIYNSIQFLNPPAGDTVWYTMVDSVFDDIGTFVTLHADSFGFVTSCSVDPNEKDVSPAGEQAEHYTLMNSELNYTLHFQNTGTDTAFTVFIEDTLDANLDKSTLQIVGSSHPVTLQMDANGALRFMFDNILLPDSNVDLPGSNGFVTYRIRPLPGLPDPTDIYNTAYIYFDMNAPVVTNTTHNMLVNQIPVGIPSQSLMDNVVLYPNPITNQSVLSFPNPENKEFSLVVMDVTGRTVAKQVTKGARFVLDRKGWNSGIYQYRLQSSDGTSIFPGRFVVNK